MEKVNSRLPGKWLEATDISCSPVLHAYFPNEQILFFRAQVLFK